MRGALVLLILGFVIGSAATALGATYDFQFEPAAPSPAASPLTSNESAPPASHPAPAAEAQAPKEEPTQQQQSVAVGMPKKKKSTLKGWTLTGGGGWLVGVGSPYLVVNGRYALSDRLGFAAWISRGTSVDETAVVSIVGAEMEWIAYQGPKQHFWDTLDVAVVAGGATWKIKKNDVPTVIEQLFAGARATAWLSGQDGKFGVSVVSRFSPWMGMAAAELAFRLD